MVVAQFGFRNIDCNEIPRPAGENAGLRNDACQSFILAISNSATTGEIPWS
jgi:hypothetical protein